MQNLFILAVYVAIFIIFCAYTREVSRNGIRNVVDVDPRKRNDEIVDWLVHRYNKFRRAAIEITGEMTQASHPRAKANLALAHERLDRLGELLSTYDEAGYRVATVIMVRLDLIMIDSYLKQVMIYNRVRVSPTSVKSLSTIKALSQE